MESLKVIQLNVLAWTFHRSKEIGSYIQAENADVVLLNSTGVLDPDRIKIFGYNIHSKNKYQERQSGIAIAVRKNIIHQLLDDFIEDVLAIKVSTRRGDIIIGTTYLPPRRPMLPEADILKLLQKTIPVYILADFNGAHRALGHTYVNETGRRIQDLIDRNIARFLGPDFTTFISARSTGKPDILLANRQAHLNYALKRGNLTSSDHWPVILALSTKPIIVEQQPRYNFKRANWENFKADLELQAATIINDNVVKDKNYIDEKFRKWFNVIHTARDNNIPMTTFQILPHPLESDRLKLIQWQCDRLIERSRINGWTPEIRQLIKNLQDEIVEECTKLYNETWTTLLHEIDFNIKNPGMFWSKVKKLLGGGNEQAAYIIHNRQRIYSDEGKEAVFRELWRNIFSITPEENRQFDRINEQLVNNFVEEHREDITPFQFVDLTRLLPDNVLTRPVRPSEIKSIINNFQNKAPGESKVNKTILKQLPPVMINIFTEATNETFSMGYYPDLYKKGMIRFCGKPGKPLTSAMNYRPISLLEVPGKIIEKVILQRLVKHLTDNNLLNPNQFGFTKGRGTQTALAKLYEIVAMSQKEGKGCNIISRDISKAFDKVWHSGLKYKLIYAELPDILLKILCSFIDGRTACIKIGNFMGPEFPLLSGVPQGAILSPTLFNYYTFDTPRPSAGCDQVIFADDHTQVVTYDTKRSKRTLAVRTVREINKINDYEKKWKIATNPTKFQMLSISAIRPADVIVDGRNIPFNRNIKVLGITLSRTGLTRHFSDRVTKAKFVLSKVRRFRNCSVKTNLRLFKMLVRPVLEYPAVIMSLASKTRINDCQAVQNKAIRRVFKQSPPYHNTCQELHEQIRLEALNVRFHRLGNRTLDRLVIIDNDTVEKSRLLNEDHRRDHNWWPRLLPVLDRDSPPPIYRH